jgi:hypothetical protein
VDFSTERGIYLIAFKKRHSRKRFSYLKSCTRFILGKGMAFNIAIRSGAAFLGSAAYIFWGIDHENKDMMRRVTTPSHKWEGF